MKLRIGTSQFPVSADIRKNQQHILEQIKAAKNQGCDIIHFPEGALSGYAGVDFASFKGFDWELLKICTMEIQAFAAESGIRALVGSTHPLSRNAKPHNSLYFINEKGEIADRYDKRFCAGDDTGTTGDLAHYTPGNYFSIFTINGIKCSMLICHDYRYPELYRELKKREVQVVFHSYHAGNMSPERKFFMEAEIGEANFSLNPGRTYPEITMPATMISYAANNYLWISCSNTSAPESCFGAFMVRPDGVICGKAEKNQEGILFTEITAEKDFYDSTQYWRSRAMNGVYHSGRYRTDSRSENRNIL